MKKSQYSLSRFTSSISKPKSLWFPGIHADAARLTNELMAIPELQPIVDETGATTAQVFVECGAFEDENGLIIVGVWVVCPYGASADEIKRIVKAHKLPMTKAELANSVEESLKRDDLKSALVTICDWIKNA